MDASEAVRLLAKKLKQVDDVIAAGRFDSLFMEWVQSTSLLLKEIFGDHHQLAATFVAKKYGLIPNELIVGGLGMEKAVDERKDQRFREAMESQRGLISAGIELLERSGIPEAKPVVDRPARIFISHGHAPDVLNDIEHSLRDDLGLDPVIVKQRASESQAVDVRVEAAMDSCDAIIIVATADDKLENGESQPRQNVVHEVGLAQAKMPERIIYLKESGATFPSNIAPKIWESFTRDDMGPAYRKIVRELRAFELFSPRPRP